MSKKVNDALKKYYSTLGYDTGVKAFKRGGNIGFAPSKFTDGGNLLHDPESLYGLYLRGQYGYGKLENPTVITPESTQTLAGGTTLRAPKKSEFDWSNLLEGDQGQSSLPLGKNVNMSTPWSAIAGTAGSLTVDLQRLIDAQIRKNDSHVYNPLVSAGLAKGGRKFDGGGFSSSPMDIAGSAVKIAANAVNQASLTTDYDVFQDAVNRYTANQISSINGITDNDSLMNAYANMYQLSDNIKGRDFRDKTVLGDITDGLASSFEGFNATGNWIGAVVGGVSSNIGSIIGRIRANKAANRAEELVRKRNQEIDTRLFHASQDVDRRNDIMRMIGYYNDPFEYAYGGEMRTHGSDFNNGLTFINEGGRHEDNPYEGVPSGVDADGIPNLVEEGEVIWNDEYVFSDRLKVPETLSKKYKLGREKTFAEAIKEVTKESLTRPNDPISNETNRAIVNEFMDAQEALREEEQAKAARQLQTAYDEDFMNQLAAFGPQGGMPMQEGLQLPPQGMNEEGMPIEGSPVGFAFGGNKFYGGGWENLMNFLENKYNKSLTKGGISGTYAIDKNFPLGNYKTIKELEQSDIYRRFTDYVIDHSDDEDVQAYLKLLDKKTHSGVTKLFENGKLRKGWEDLYRHRRNDHAGGIYHFSASVDNILKGLDSKQASKKHTPEDEQKRLVNLLQGIPFPGKVEGYPNLHYVDKDGHRYYLDTSTIKFYDDLSKVPGYKAPEKPQTGGRVIYTYPSGNKITVNPDGTVSDPEHGASYSNYDEFLSDPSWSLNLEESVVSDIKKSGPLKGTKSVSDLNATEHDEVIPFKYRPTWQRYAPVIGSAMATLYGMFNRPDYTNADEIIKAARAAGVPVNIPVQTIGDYRVRNPYDERYLVNMANQNMAAGQRSLYNTSGGNRAMDMLGAMNLAHNNQVNLGEIMRQAYLANRQDDAQVSEFNRGTNIQNMNAINQRNLAQAQLNSQRQSTALSGLARGYGMRQGIKDSWDAATMQSLNSMLASLGAIGKENEEYNMMTSMAEHRYYPYFYGDRGAMQLVQQPTQSDFNPNWKVPEFKRYTWDITKSKGGNKKKRRF